MKKNHKSVLLIGPFPDPISGVSLANKVVAEILEVQEAFSIKKINTSYSRFDEAVGRFSLHKLLFNLSFFPKVFNVFGKDIVYMTPGQTFFGLLKYAPFILASTLLKKELIIHVHGNYLGTMYKQLSGIKKKMFRYLASRATKGIVLSASLKQNMTPFIEEHKIKILPNFAQDFLVDKVSKNHDDGLRIIYLSNLMEEKGIFDLLDALELLETQNIPYKAQIAGAIDPSNKNRTERKLQHLKNTNYLGVVNGHSKKEILHWGTVFVLPTYYKMEGQPISILEAIGTGNVILATSHAGIPDILQEGKQGYFIEKQDAKSIADKLKYLSETSEKVKEISQSNLSYFKEHFTLDSFKQRLIQIFLD